MKKQVRKFLTPQSAAQKALSLQKDGVFRLLVVMTVLLGWVVSMGFGSIVVMQNMYSEWHLSRSQEVSVYLMADTSERQVGKLSNALIEKSDVQKVTQMFQEDVKSLIAPYLDYAEGGVSFPLPVVLNVKVNSDVNRDALTQDIKKIIPEAEVDDARALLATISKAVRVGQFLAVGLSACLFAVMAFLVALTVRTGLRAQKQTVAILRYIGSTDAFLQKIVIQQVVRRALLGWCVAVVLSGLSFGALVYAWPLLLEYVQTYWLLLAMLGAPLVLPILAHFAAQTTTRKILLR